MEVWKDKWVGGWVGDECFFPTRVDRPLSVFFSLLAAGRANGMFVAVVKAWVRWW